MNGASVLHTECFQKGSVSYPALTRDSPDQNGSQGTEDSGYTSIPALVHSHPYCNAPPAGLSLTGARSPGASPAEAITLSVISRQPQTRLPKTLGRDGDDDSDYAVSTVYQAWFSGPHGHMSLSKMAISSGLHLLH